MQTRGRTDPFRPVVTLGLVYFALIFVAVMLLLISPTLWEVARIDAPPEQKQALIEAAARDAARPRLLIGLLGALALTAIGIRAGVLPGLRPPR